MTTPSVDAETAWAITAMPHPDADSANRWVEVLRTAWDESGDDWNPLAEAIRTAAASNGMDSSAVEDFLSGVEQTGRGTDLIGELVQLDSALPDLYWQLAYPPAEADPMAWVSDGLDQRAAALFGDSWPTDLKAQLDSRWGDGWEQNPDEYKSAWLADLLTEWEQPAPAQDVELAAAEAITAAVAEIEGAEELTPAELAEIQAELAAEFSTREGV